MTPLNPATAAKLSAALAAGPLTDDEVAAIEPHAVDGTGR